MNATRHTLLLIPLILLFGACASAPKSKPAHANAFDAPTQATLTIETAPADDRPLDAHGYDEAPPVILEETESLSSRADSTTPEPLPDASDAVATETGTRTEAEDDFAALYGDSSTTTGINDPWERFNREMHGFNNAIDYVILRPVARGYQKVTPRPVRTGVSNFFANLKSPAVMVNQLLQGHPIQASKTFARFLINSTLGIGGILDPASDAKLPPRTTDFGQTLAVWGWKDSRYLVLPFFGPRTVRDSVGLGGDTAMSLTWRIDDDATRYSVQALGMVDARSRMLSLDDIRDGAFDDYILVRDAWMQRRRYLVNNAISSDPAADSDLPDYFHDDPDQSIP